MKKLLFVLFQIICMDGWSQGKDWFISLSTSYMVNGPGYQVKEKMHEQFFNSYVVGFLWDHENPFRGWELNLMAKGGKRVTSKTMVYALAGLADKGWVRGYRESSTGIPGAESHPRIDYKLYQFAAGMMYYPGKIKAGVAPSIYLLDYRFHGEKNKSSVSPALNFSLQIPVSNHQKNPGLDLLLDVNYGTPVKMYRDSHGSELFQPGTLRMLNCSFGLTITLH